MIGLPLFGMAAAPAWAMHRTNPVLGGALAVALAAPSRGLIAACRVEPWHMPQWALFLPIAALSGPGLL